MRARATDRSMCHGAMQCVPILIAEYNKHTAVFCVLVRAFQSSGNRNRPTTTGNQHSTHQNRRQGRGRSPASPGPRAACSWTSAGMYIGHQNKNSWGNHDGRRWCVYGQDTQHKVQAEQQPEAAPFSVGEAAAAAAPNRALSASAGIRFTTRWA